MIPAYRKYDLLLVGEESDSITTGQPTNKRGCMKHFLYPELGRIVLHKITIIAVLNTVH